MYARTYSLQQQHRIAKLFGQKQSIQGRYVIIKYRPSAQGHLRFAIVVGKKVDKRAPIRNRLRRVTSEVLRHSVIPQHPTLSCDVLIILKKSSLTPSENLFQTLTRELPTLFASIAQTKTKTAAHSSPPSHIQQKPQPAYAPTAPSGNAENPPPRNCTPSICRAGG